MTKQNSNIQSYSSQELRKKLKSKKWIMSYNSLMTIVDPKSNKVMYIEDYGPNNGYFTEGWRALHFPLTSSIVEKSYREGNITICILKNGKANLQLIPSFAPIGIEECRITKNNQVQITIAGYGGGGVSASFSRGMAKGVNKIEVLQEGGGTKLGKGRISLPAKKLLLVGVDDTDNNEVGATYALVHNISVDISKKYNATYSIHNNIQLYPYNPYKTKNCMSTVVGVIYDTENQKKKIIEEYKRLLKKHTVSPETGMATFEGFSMSANFLDFCQSLKFRMLEDINELKNICKTSNVNLHTITGEKGLIGAVAALGFYDQPEFAAKLPGQCL